MTARTLMLQGTSSGVGKTLIAAALCRILRRRGLSVLPFKAQNMALNAAVTADSGEVARAQALQAAACGVDVTTDMNPILLKPEADSCAQVIVRGRVVGRTSAAEYHRLKPMLWPVVAESLDRLRAACDVVVVEGAGSPAEVNLRDHDIVNMRVAEHARAPVLLVADIDRGGVFAALLGTVQLLRPRERRLVRAIIVNNFRGDPRLFAGGVDFLERRLRLPVLGTVPHLPGLHLAEEDSLGLSRLRHDAAPAQIDVAVVGPPRISNFDDCDPLLREPGVGVRLVEEGNALGDPDLVVLPGSKATLADLAALRQRGMEDALRAARQHGSAVLGICGGFQLIGTAIDDPDGSDSGHPGRAPAFAMLPVSTRMLGDKVVRRVTGEVLDVPGLLAHARGAAVRGYEIHTGRTDQCRPPLRLHAGGDSWDDGATSEDGWVVGTHVHGLLEDPVLRRALLRATAVRRGRSWHPAAQVPDTQQELDRLADHVAAALDIDQLLAIVAAGVP